MVALLIAAIISPVIKVEKREILPSPSTKICFECVPGRTYTQFLPPMGKSPITSASSPRIMSVSSADAPSIFTPGTKYAGISTPSILPSAIPFARSESPAGAGRCARGKAPYSEVIMPEARIAVISFSAMPLSKRRARSPSAMALLHAAPPPALPAPSASFFSACTRPSEIKRNLVFVVPPSKAMYFFIGSPPISFCFHCSTKKEKNPYGFIFFLIFVRVL